MNGEPTQLQVTRRQHTCGKLCLYWQLVDLYRSVGAVAVETHDVVSSVVDLLKHLAHRVIHKPHVVHDHHSPVRLQQRTKPL